jgi:hypothetical protein
MIRSPRFAWLEVFGGRVIEPGGISNDARAEVLGGDLAQDCCD